jgi:hypothetical protein
LAGAEDGRSSLATEAIDADEPTDEAIGDWHYWVAQGGIL